MNTELTPWFVNGEKPAYVGVYQTVDTCSSRGWCYQFWNGNQWNYAHSTIEQAAQCSRSTDMSCFQNDPWRGLAEKP